LSKSLRSMTESERKAAIERRLREAKGGNGFWAAVDASGESARKHIANLKGKK
jgi:hypothetical protein